MFYVLSKCLKQLKCAGYCEIGYYVWFNFFPRIGKRMGERSLLLNDSLTGKMQYCGKRS